MKITVGQPEVSAEQPAVNTEQPDVSANQVGCADESGCTAKTRRVDPSEGVVRPPSSASKRLFVVLERIKTVTEDAHQSEDSVNQTGSPAKKSRRASQPACSVDNATHDSRRSDTVADDSDCSSTKIRRVATRAAPVCAKK